LSPEPNNGEEDSEPEYVDEVVMAIFDSQQPQLGIANSIKRKNVRFKGYIFGSRKS